jgi:hypothetical protein
MFVYQYRLLRIVVNPSFQRLNLKILQYSVIHSLGLPESSTLNYQSRPVTPNHPSATASAAPARSMRDLLQLDFGIFCCRTMRDQVQDSSRARTAAIRLTSSASSITPLTMRECARETSWLSGKGSSAYWCSERRSSSSRRVRAGRTVAHSSSASHIPSRLDFQGGTGLVTPYFSAILLHTCPRSTS